MTRLLPSRCLHRYKNSFVSNARICVSRSKPRTNLEVCLIERFAKWIFHCVILIVFLPCYAPAQSAPTITGMSSSALVNPFGQPVTIQGTSFGASQGTVTFGGVPAAPNSWIDTKIVVPVPAGVVPGSVDVVVTTVSDASSNAKTLKVM